MDDIIIRAIKLPLRVRGYTTVTPDGDYCVYVNQCHSYEMQRQAAGHEIEHIKKGHFEDGRSVYALEAEA